MRPATAFILALVLSLPIIAKAGIYAHYLLNKTFYAEVLCENRARPQLQCEGRCHLSEELQAADEVADTPQGALPPKTVTDTSMYVFPQLIIYAGISPAPKLDEGMFDWKWPAVDDVGADIFHPPC